MLGVLDLLSVDQREVCWLCWLCWLCRSACVLTEIVERSHVRSRHAGPAPGLAELSVPGQRAGLHQVGPLASLQSPGSPPLLLRLASGRVDH